MSITRTTFFLLVIFSVLQQISVAAPNQDKWKQIVAIQSSRKDIEKLFGKSQIINHDVDYDFDDVSIRIEYSDGKCDSSIDIDWNAPEWTVQNAVVTFRDDFFVSSLGIDLMSLKKKPNGIDTPGIYSYLDDKNGYEYIVDETDDDLGHHLVSIINIFPASRYKNLSCGLTRK